MLFLKGEPTARMQLIQAIEECAGISKIKKLIKAYGDEMWWEGWDSAIDHERISENSVEFCHNERNY